MVRDQSMEGDNHSRGGSVSDERPTLSKRATPSFTRKRPQRRRSVKSIANKCETDEKSDKEAEEEDVVEDDTLVDKLLPRLHLASGIPIAIIIAGIKSYCLGRKDHSEKERRALWDALEDISMEVEDLLPDGIKLTLPWYTQRKHTESRAVAAKYSLQIAPERTAQRLVDLLGALRDVSSD